MKQFRIKPLNMVGASHIIALMLVVVGVGLFGMYKLVESHADTLPTSRVQCSDSHSTYLYSNGHRYEKYNCNFDVTAPVVDHNQVQVGTIHAGSNWILCQQQGKTIHYGPYNDFDNWWAWTMADNGKWGWVNGVYGHGGSNNDTMGSTNGAFGIGIGACTGINTYGGAPATASSSPYKVSCTAGFGNGAPGVEINTSVTYKNIGGSTSPATLQGYIGFAGGNSSGGGAGMTAQFSLPALAAGQSYTKATAVGPYPKGTTFTLTAGAYTPSYQYTTCSGSRSYVF